MKICSKCKVPKAETDFYLSNGKLMAACKKCKCESSKKYRDGHKEELKETISAWHKKHWKKMRVWKNKWQRDKRKKDLGFRIRQNLSGHLSKFVTGVNRRSIRVLVGCSMDDVRAHLESLFRPGMSWENYGRVWEIDHVRPCASFDLRNPEHQAECNNWTNLQPLFKRENRSKSDHYIL